VRFKRDRPVRDLGDADLSAIDGSDPGGEITACMALPAF